MRHGLALRFTLFIAGIGLAYFAFRTVQVAAAGHLAQTGVEGNAIRRGIESDILASTVRVYYRSWIVKPDESGYLMYESYGYATVKDGRYLVTHNHTDIPLSIRYPEGSPEPYTQVFLFDSEGELRHAGPLTDFSIALEETETLVLAHKEDGFLTSLGFTSADFGRWGSLGLEVGMEVAQIDWDGERARVDWVLISDLPVSEGVPRVLLADGAMVGASGGGIFLRGVHFANNWRVEEHLDSFGNVVAQYTTGALNSQAVAGDSS